MSIDHLEVSASSLACRCDPDQLGFETTDEIAPLEGTIGHERAISAMELALDIDAPGYNLFIAGLPGTGRTTALRAHLDQIAREKPVPDDWGYVHNFHDSSQPKCLSLSCGMVRELKHDMDVLVDTCRREIPKAFESDDYTHRIEEFTKDIQERRQTHTEALEREAQALGFTLQTTQIGITPVPLMQGRPMTQEEFGNLTDTVRSEIREKADQLQHSITHLMQELRRLGQEAEAATNQIDAEFVRFTLTPIIDELQDKYVDHSEVVSHLDLVENDMVENLEIFKPRREDILSSIPGVGRPSVEDDPFIKYRVNDLIDNANCEGAPVIFEYSPTYYNLFGRIEYRARIGTYTTDLTMIKPGALHRANGGYIVLQARDVLMNPLSWETLKRTIRSEEIRIENIGEQYSPLPSATLRPQPIPFYAKVILIGSYELVRLLQAFDEDFRRYFKVTADFDFIMDRTSENMSKYASFVGAMCRGNGFRPFHKTAVARIIDYSSRMVEDQEKLTTRFMSVSDMITEAEYWAKKDNSSLVMSDHVQKAIDHRNYRVSMTDDRLRELIEEGTIHISTEGKRAGQVNGLAVYSIGEYMFGKPSRITARVSLGRGQVVNIERETQLSGKIHNKGFMILNGYLQGKYGRNKPLSLSASIGFEQTYNEVEGDSASSTELYALLSELSTLQIDQGIAVTGSVNQAGDVQAIGGATHKIEGFFDVCKDKGLTGNQGVMIPRDNLKNLVLRDEVVEAVEQGRFHIYAVSTIDEGIEVLTGTPAGELQPDGTYPEGTAHNLVEKRLNDLAQSAREFSRSLSGDNNNNQSSQSE